MGWHLSQQNEKLLPPILRILSNPKAGRVEIPTPDPESLLYLIRSAGHTRYPDLLKWRYKKKERSVICIPRDPTIVLDPSTKVEEYLDYIGIISYLSEHESEPDLLFVNVLLSTTELQNLTEYCKEYNREVSKDEQGVRVFKNVQIKPEGEEADRSTS